MPYSSLYLSEFPYHLAANLSGVDDIVLILIKYKRLIREQDREVNFFSRILCGNGMRTKVSLLFPLHSHGCDENKSAVLIKLCVILL